MLPEPTISPQDAFSTAEGPVEQSGGEPQGSPGLPEGGQLQSQQQTQAPAAPVQITPEMIREAVQAGSAAASQASIAAMRASQPVPPPRAPTAEEVAEFERQFNVVKATPDLYKQIFGVAPQNAEQVKALQDVLHATARQAISMSTYTANQRLEERLKEMQTQLDQRLSPLMTAHQEVVIQKTEAEFLAANADLKDHAALVSEIAMATKAQLDAGQLREVRNADGSVNREKVFQFVADKARSLLGKAAPTGQAPGQRQTQRRFQMTPLSSGGSPGSGRPLQPANGKTISPQEVFKDGA